MRGANGGVGGGDVRITGVEATGDTLTSRAGLAFFVKYVEAIGVVDLLAGRFAGIRKNAKGVTARNMLLQVLCFFFDGTSRHLSHFDELRKDAGRLAVTEVPQGQAASSHAVKRFFGACGHAMAWTFRWALKELFIWRLTQSGAGKVVLTLDTMVMDNDEALKRQGCDPTYKKVKGFQPLHWIWEGKIVDARFRRGKRHSNFGDHAGEMIRGIVKLIRERHSAGAQITIRLDAGFFDEKLFRLCDELGIHFIATGKAFGEIKELVAALPAERWKVYTNGRQEWTWAEFEYACQSWRKGYRALYTRPKYDDRQQLLEFARPDNIIVTNAEPGTPWFDALPEADRKYWSVQDHVIWHHHQRGADELPHRGLKDFGSEELPFKRFAPNQAWYYMMLFAFFVFQTFKEDTLKDILPVTSYATTVRRRLIDIAGKIVKQGRRVILKVPQAALEALKLDELWRRCRKAPPIPLTT